VIKYVSVAISKEFSIISKVEAIMNIFTRSLIFFEFITFKLIIQKKYSSKGYIINPRYEKST